MQAQGHALHDANYNGELGGPTDVGYGKASSSGTFGQGGNAWEWNDAVIDGSSRGMRGGSSGSVNDNLASSNRSNYDPSNEYCDIGFRVASVPEPTSVVLAMVASGLLLIRRQR